MTSWAEIVNIPLFHDTFILRRPRAASFAEIIKVAITFNKTTLKDSKKVKRIKNYVLKCNLYLYFLVQQKLLISDGKDADVSRTTGMCHVIHIFSGSL